MFFGLALVLFGDLQLELINLLLSGWLGSFFFVLCDLCFMALLSVFDISSNLQSIPILTSICCNVFT